MKKTLALLLLAAMLLPAILSGCNNTPPEATTPNATTPTVTTPEVTTPEVTTPSEGGDPDTPDITSDNVLRRAEIITGDSETEIFAGEELAKYLTQKGVEIAEDGFPIILFIDETLGDDCFSIDAILQGEEASMTIRGGNGRGVLYGVYKFLERYAGVRYFTKDLEVIPEGDIVLFEGNLLTYEPYFEYRHTSWNCAATSDACSWCVKNGLNGNGHLTPELGGEISYAPGLNVHTLGKLSETGGASDPNPCLSSEEIYQTVLKNVRAILEKDPTANIVSISQNDDEGYCKCEKCAAVDAEECSPSGLMLRFVNRIAEELEKDYPNLIIDTLAYNYTQAPPIKTVPRHNVCVRLCSIRCCFMHPLTECNDAPGPNGDTWTRTEEFLKDLKGWGEICDNIYVWDYTTNFAYYIPPFSNFGSLRQNMRLYYESDVKGMFEQGNGQSPSGEFGELRAYLIAKLMWNPLMSEEEYYHHMDEFLAAYYGDGWEYIRKFIDKTTELASNAGSCINIYEAPLQSISKAEYLEYEDEFNAWWDAAEELAGNRRAYVRRSRMQWRYIELLLHPDEKACRQFIADVNIYGIRWAESTKNNYPPDKMFPDLYP
ncbi:MAG: DUF4838 domain-containing protein [Ruminococcaceae bacterium]|nr:DUF4838 domain-containing protein [Oscillospiraceae bacterium]